MPWQDLIVNLLATAIWSALAAAVFWTRQRRMKREKEMEELAVAVGRFLTSGMTTTLRLGAVLSATLIQMRYERFASSNRMLLTLEALSLLGLAAMTSGWVLWIGLVLLLLVMGLTFLEFRAAIRAADRFETVCLDAHLEHVHLASELMAAHQAAPQKQSPEATP